MLCILPFNTLGTTHRDYQKTFFKQMVSAIGMKEAVYRIVLVVLRRRGHGARGCWKES